MSTSSYPKSPQFGESQSSAAAVGNTDFRYDPASEETESIQKMRYFHRVVQNDLEARGDKVFRYRNPNPFMFAVTAVGMFLAVDLAVAAGPFASDFSRDVSAPRHWDWIKSATGGRIDLEGVQRTIFDFIVGKSFTGNTLLSFAVTTWLSVARVRDARKALKFCRRVGADAGVSTRYAIGVFLCGMAQMASLEDEKIRVQRLNRLPHFENRSGGAVSLMVVPPLSKHQPTPNASPSVAPSSVGAIDTDKARAKKAEKGENEASKPVENGSLAAVVNTLQRYSSSSPASSSVVDSEASSHGCATEASADTSPAIVPAKTTDVPSDQSHKILS